MLKKIETQNQKNSFIIKKRVYLKTTKISETCANL